MLDTPFAGLIALGVTIVIVALICHRLIKSYLIASLIAGPAASLAVQVVAYFDAGYLDPFFLVAFVTGTLISFGVALVVGLPFKWVRSKKQYGL